MKGGTISGNSGPVGAGVYAFSGGLIQVENGVIYGKDAPADLANKGGGGMAIHLEFGKGYRGTFARDSAGNDIFTKTADFKRDEVNTVRVKKGELVP